MIKLNLGCANDVKEGYVNIDLFHTNPKVEILDVRNISKFKDQEVVEIFASDVIEHLGFQDAVRAVAHWVNILARGGRMLIQTTCISSQIDALLAGHWDLPTFNAKVFAGKGWIDGVSRDQDWHKSAFTLEFLVKLLENNGMQIEKTSVDQYTPGRTANLNMSIWAKKS